MVCQDPRGTLIIIGRGLRSEDGENPEYDRALVEIIAEFCGYPIDESDDARAAVLHDDQSAVDRMLAG